MLLQSELARGISEVNLEVNAEHILVEIRVSTDVDHERSYTTNEHKACSGGSCVHTLWNLLGQSHSVGNFVSTLLNRTADLCIGIAAEGLDMR